MLMPLGYRWLIDQYHLPARPLAADACVDTSVKGRETRRHGDLETQVFEAKDQPNPTLVAHLQFALRYEGVNLEVLALLFERAGEGELNEWLAATPDSMYARRAGYLFEWLTGRRLKPRVGSRRTYVKLLDTSQQFGPETGPRDSRYRVIDNVPGTRDFCPLVRRTEYLVRMVESDLRARVHAKLASYDASMLHRAAAFLYLKETQSSFEIEREKPSANRAQRFADLLRQADLLVPLTEERLVELQNAVVDPRFHEFSWRGKQNWVGKDLGYRKQVDFMPPRPADVPRLMRGLLDMTTRNPEMDAVVFAASVAFGFVFVHPFMDGNGRIHRYLIHEILTQADFTPRGIVLPVSAVMLANLDQYIAALEAFSKPIRERTDWNPDTADISARGNDSYLYRYYDATVQAEFLYGALERTVEEDLEREIAFLLGFDRAHRELNAFMDWPDKDLDLFIRLVHQNGFKLSTNKRASHFGWMKEEELATAEGVVAEAFRAGDTHDQ